MENTRDTIQNEAYFKYSIQMALQNKFSWTTLASMLDQMTPTVGQSKELVRVLLKELQNLQKKHQELITDKIHRNKNDEVENLGELENTNVQGFDENIQKDVGQINNHELPSLENEIEDVEKKIEIDEESFVDDTYDFVGSDWENDQTISVSNSESPTKNESKDKSTERT